MALRRTAFMDKTADLAAKGLLDAMLAHPEIRLPFVFFAAALAERFGWHAHPIFTVTRHPKLAPQWETITPDLEDRFSELYRGRCQE